MEKKQERIVCKLFKINKETNEFIGFYDSEIHNLQPDGIEYFELSEENWQALLENQSLGEEIRILNQFEPMTISTEFIPQIGTYKKPPMPEGIVKGEFNYRDEIWEEKATNEDKVLDLRTRANSDLRSTDKFEDGAYRRRLTDEEKFNIDSYRDELLDIVDGCNSMLSSNVEILPSESSEEQTDNFVLPELPVKPEFVKRYI